MIKNTEDELAAERNREAQELAANLTADKVAMVSEKAEKNRSQQIIESTTQNIVASAQKGACRFCRVNVRDPDVAAYFKKRGFKVSSIDPGGGMLIQW